MTEDSAGDCGCDCPNRGATGTPGVSTKVCPAEDNDCWKRHSNAGHGESPFSGLGLALSGSFFLPPKIPKIFCKGFFFFSPDCAEVSTGAWPVAWGGRFGS